MRLLLLRSREDGRVGEIIKTSYKQKQQTFEGLQVDVYRVINHFFGESITVAGLLTGRDIVGQLQDKDLGDCLLIPENTLRAGEDTLLDDMTVDQLSAALGVPVCPSANDGVGFVESVLGVKLCE